MSFIKSWLGRLVSFASLILALYMDYSFFQSNIQSGSPNTFNKFMFAFLSTLLLLMISFPLIIKNITETKLHTFLAIPSNESRVNYVTIISFLSEQSLGSFLINISIITGRNILTAYNPYLSGTFIVIAFIFCIFIVAGSLARLIFSLKHYPIYIYSFLSIIAFSISLGFFEFGIKLAN